MQLSSDSFEAIVDLFDRAAGIRYSADKRTLVAGRLTRLAQEAGATDLDGYVKSLVQRRDPGEVRKVVDRLTTNETYFFREPAHFDFLRELARRWRGQAGGQPFRLWSAASSSGEEGYSAAMVLADSLGLAGWEIVGTDLSSAMVEAARTGLYRMERTEGIPAASLQRYARKGRGPYEGQFLVVRELRDRLRFFEANLTRDLPDIGQFQVVFLRNVLIYFDQRRKREIIARVVDRLVPGGILMVGHSESVSGVNEALVALRPSIYEKRLPA